MAEKELGYVELEWTCPSCNTRNPGSAQKCKQCGTPMPADVKFEQAAEEPIIQDQATIAAAKAGPDIYCAYCGTRNVATAKVCKQCNAPLSEGTAREAGGVVGALRDKPAPPQKCPSCGAENQASALKCIRCGAPLGKAVPAAAQTTPPSSPRRFGLVPLVLIGVVIVIAIVALISLAGRRSSSVAQVADYGWRRSIAVQQLAPVTHSAWREQLPAGAEIVGCEKQVFQTVDQPVAGAREVCGTPYVVDTGTGFGKVQQDCQYQVLEDFCRYRAMEWVAAPAIVLEGRDFNPRWPAANLASNQRAGGQTEEYTIVFRTNDRTYTYSTRSLEEYLKLAQGTRWKLTINGFGQITSIDPA